MIDESSIRERAYALWEQDSYPEGASKFYWHLAQEQLEAQLRLKEAYIGLAEDSSVESESYLIHAIRVPLEANT